MRVEENTSYLPFAFHKYFSLFSPAVFLAVICGILDVICFKSYIIEYII